MDIEKHLEESKRQLLELADKRLLNESDLELDTRHFAAGRQKLDNVILQEYLVDHANERMNKINDIFGDDSVISKKYATDLTSFIQEILGEKL